MKILMATASFLFALGYGAAVQATPVTYDFSCTFDCVAATGQQQLNFTSEGHLLVATPFFSQRGDGTGRLLNAISTSEGASYATLTSWSTGLGLENPVNANEDGIFNSGIDNRGRKDFVLFEFDGIYTLKSFELGWQRAPSGARDTTRFADLQFWIGGPDTAGFALKNKCVSGCANTTNDLANLGFTALSDFDDVPYGDVLFGEGLQTRYLLVSGNLGENDDFFDFKRLTLNSVLAIPEPHAGYLLGLAFLSMLGVRHLRRLPHR
jgi:hypothetical protein